MLNVTGLRMKVTITLSKEVGVATDLGKQPRKTMQSIETVPKVEIARGTVIMVITHGTAHGTIIAVTIHRAAMVVRVNKERATQAVTKIVVAKNVEKAAHGSRKRIKKKEPRKRSGSGKITSGWKRLCR